MVPSVGNLDFWLRLCGAWHNVVLPAVCHTVQQAASMHPRVKDLSPPLVLALFHMPAATQSVCRCARQA